MTPQKFFEKGRGQGHMTPKYIDIDAFNSNTYHFYHPAIV